MGVNKIISVSQQKAECPEEHKEIQKKLEVRRSHSYIPAEGESWYSDNSHSRNIYILAFTIGKYVDLNAQLSCHEGPIVNAERGPPGSKKWLRRYNQSFLQ
jgi:hypothetical protein